MLSGILGTLLAITAVGLWISVKRNLEFVDRLEELDSTIQSARNALLEVHADIEQKSKIEVFFDEPVVRDLLKSMTIAKEAVNTVAQLLDEVTEEGDPEERDET